MHNLFKNVEPRRVKPDGTNWEMTAGTGDTLTSNSVDTTGYTSVSAVYHFGALTTGAVVTVKLQHSNDDGVTDAYTDIAGTAQTIPVADANKMLITGIFKPQKRYLRTVITRATANAVVDAVTLFLALPNNAPVSYGSTVSGTPEFFNSPASGTA